MLCGDVVWLWCVVMLGVMLCVMFSRFNVTAQVVQFVSSIILSATTATASKSNILSVMEAETMIHSDERDLLKCLL